MLTFNTAEFPSGRHGCVVQQAFLVFNVSTSHVQPLGHCLHLQYTVERPVQLLQIQSTLELITLNLGPTPSILDKRSRSFVLFDAHVAVQVSCTSRNTKASMLQLLSCVMGIDECRPWLPVHLLRMFCLL